MPASDDLPSGARTITTEWRVFEVGKSGKLKLAKTSFETWADSERIFQTSYGSEAEAVDAIRTQGDPWGGGPYVAIPVHAVREAL